MQYIEELRTTYNAQQEQISDIASRHVPVFFGIGMATLGEEGFPNDNLKQAIDRADSRMQANKDAARSANYAKLKQFFELRKGREVSMRDDRRQEFLTEAEREEIRKRRINNLMF